MDLRWAFVAALVWCYTMVARRIFRGRPIPGLLVLGCLGITVRTMIYLLSANAFIYFVQPILRTLVTAATFGLSVVIGRPLIAKFAADFCPLSPDVLARPAIVQLFRRLTYLWAGVNALAAAVSLTLLLTVPTAVFVGTATVAAWAITCTGVLTVSDSVRTARSGPRDRDRAEQGPARVRRDTGLTTLTVESDRGARHRSRSELISSSI